jgi:hypothetical protein
MGVFPSRDVPQAKTVLAMFIDVDLMRDAMTGETLKTA